MHPGGISVAVGVTVAISGLALGNSGFVLCAIAFGGLAAIVYAVKKMALLEIFLHTIILNHFSQWFWTGQKKTKNMIYINNAFLFAILLSAYIFFRSGVK